MLHVVPSVRNELMHGLVSSVSEQAIQNRFDEIAGLPNPIMRASALAINKFAINNPHCVAHMFGMKLGEPNLKLIGSGGTAIVFELNPASVLKVDWISMLMPDSKLAAFAETTRTNYQILADRIGGMMLPQTVQIDHHPFIGNARGIQTTQPYRDIHDPKLLEAGSASAMAHKIQALSNTQPQIVEQLEDLVNASHELYDSYAVLPDILGKSNLAVDNETGKLILIDGQPLTTELPKAFFRAAWQRLDNLRQALAS